MRYILFGGYGPIPKGGWNDLIDWYYDKEEANDVGSEYDWHHVVDIKHE
jgi:hypothetical protein